MSRDLISVVLPCFNEQELIPALYERLSRAARTWDVDVEFLAIDDGSTDQTSGMLHAICIADPRWKLLRFSRNFGHQAAVSAGLQYCQGDAVVVMDSDLQDPPEELHRFLKQWREGYQVVYAIRTRRKESWWKRCAYFLFYRVLRLLSTIEIPLDSGDFSLMDRSVVNVLNQMPERARFVRGLRSWAGFRQTGIIYERDRRHSGSAKYTLRRLIRLALNGILSFSSAPLRVASYLGFLFCGLSILLIALLIVWRLLDVEIMGSRPGNSAGWTSLFSLILLLSGLQMLVIGAIGEYLARVFDQVQNRPLWIIGYAAGFSTDLGDGAPGWFATEKFAPPKVSWCPEIPSPLDSENPRIDHATVL